MNESEIKSVCIFCGSKVGRLPVYEEAAKQLGSALAEANIRLVYGGGDVGIMGATATAARGSGGNILGVMPTHLLNSERIKENLKSLIITENMHERKKVMFMNSDAVIALPGGLGTLDELFEVITWKQLGLHTKPIYVLNIENYWDPLISLIKSVVDEKFAEHQVSNLFKVFEKVVPLVTDIQSYKN